MLVVVVFVVVLEVKVVMFLAVVLLLLICWEVTQAGVLNMCRLELANWKAMHVHPFSTILQ